MRSMRHSTGISGCSMVFVHRFQSRQRFDLRPQLKMQLQRDVRILGGIFGGAVHIDLIEGNLLRALADHVLQMNGFDAEIFLGGRHPCHGASRRC